MRVRHAPAHRESAPTRSAALCFVLSGCVLLGLAADQKAHAASFERLDATTIEGVRQPIGYDAYVRDLSADGRFAVFVSYDEHLDASLTPTLFAFSRVWLYDAQSQSLELISVDSNELAVDSHADSPSVSGDGMKVVFRSCGRFDAGHPAVCGIYLRDRGTGSTRLVSLDGKGQAFGNPQLPVISRNGEQVAFSVFNGSTGRNSDVYRVGLFEPSVQQSNIDAEGISFQLAAGVGAKDVSAISISDDGSRVAFVRVFTRSLAGGGNFSGDHLFLRDHASASTLWVSEFLPEFSQLTAGVEASFESATVSVGQFTPRWPRWLSGNGQVVAFNSSGGLLAEDSDSAVDGYKHDLVSATTVLLTQLADGSQVATDSYALALSSDGGRSLLRSSSGFFAGSTLAVRQPDGAMTPVERDPDDGLATCCSASNGVLSGDGNVVAFRSFLSLTSDDNNRTTGDLFRIDLGLLSTQLITRPDAGADNRRALANNGPPFPLATGPNAFLSNDGSLALFSHFASNLVAGDDNRTADLFVRQRPGDIVARVGAPVRPRQQCDILSFDSTPDGRYSVFASCGGLTAEASHQGHIYRYDRSNGELLLIDRASGLDGSVGNQAASFVTPSISADGQKVLFASAANNLVADDSNNNTDLFLRDLGNASTTRVSLDNGGQPLQTIGALYLHLTDDGSEMLLSTVAALDPGDSNAGSDAYARPLAGGPWERLSLGPNGEQLTGHISLRGVSADGRRLLFTTPSAVLNSGGGSGIFVRDRDAAITRRVDVSNDGQPVQPGTFQTSTARLSDDGRFVVMALQTTGFLPGEASNFGNLYVHDLERAVTARLTVRNDGQAAVPAGTFVSGMSPNGRYVAFFSYAYNLLDVDANSFLPDLLLVENPLFGEELTSDVDTLTPATTEPSLEATVSADGRFVVFESLDPKLHAPCPGIANPPPLCGSDGMMCPPTGVLYVFRLDVGQGCVDLVSADNASAPILMRGRAKGGADPLLGKPGSSADGSQVAFVAEAAAIGKLWGEGKRAAEARRKQGGPLILMRNMLTGTTRMLGASAPAGLDPASGQTLDGGRPQPAADGQSVVYTGLFGGKPAVLQGRFDGLGQLNTFCVSCNRPAGGSGSDPAGFTEPLDGFAHNAAVSANGEVVVYQTVAKNAAASGCNNGSNQTSVVLRNMLTGFTRTLNQPQGVSCQLGSAGKPRIDFSGSQIVFESTQPLTTGAAARPEVYLFDAGANRLRQISVDGLGGQVDSGSAEPTISGDGRLIAFTSPARRGFGAELDAAAPPVNHVVVRELRSNRVNRLSKNLNGLDANADSARPSLSYTGEFVVFDSAASNLSSADGNGATRDVFLRVNPTVREVVFGNGFD